MDRNIPAGDCNDNPISVYSGILNDLLRAKIREQIPEGEQNWIAESVLKIPAPSLSAYINGTRAVPAWLVPVVDKAFKTEALLEILTQAVRSGPPVHKPIDPRTVTKLFVLALREEGVFNAMLAQEIADHFQEPEALDHLERELNKLNHFLIAMRERLQETRATARHAS